MEAAFESIAKLIFGQKKGRLTMKRLALILTVVSTLAVLETATANAADNYRGHAGHGVVSHGYAGYGHGLQYSHGYFRHNAPPVYGHGVVVRHHGYGGHGYVAPVHGGHGFYRSYGHGRGVRISTPHFGLRIGH